MGIKQETNYTLSNPTSNISYTSKDFLTIFPDLLNLAKELTSRWDPSVANKSDPGLILLELNAIIGDKLNYNIDKNILEAFPQSLTQASSARKLYSVLGYNMQWYKSATTLVLIAWKGDSIDGSVKIPAFTMLSNSDNTVQYTLLGGTTGDDENENLVNELELKLNGDTISYKAMLGISVKYDVNGETKITTQNLDGNNRLYFDTTDVASNGIFICNYGTNVYDWNRVDNLLIQKMGLKNYQFGVDDDGYSCYIEFPEDAEDLMRDGIEIVYLRTLGELGNVKALDLTHFYGDLQLKIVGGDLTVTLTLENTAIQNYLASTDGANIETVNQAYENYKKTVGTFDTLITLRDYINAILSSGIVSNCYVTDRTNDPLCSYTINAIQNGVKTKKTVVEQTSALATKADGSGTVDILIPAISSTAIKLYLFEDVVSLDTKEDYNKTFALSENLQVPIKSYLNNKKHIGQEYANIINTDTEKAKSHPCLFKNVYSISARIYSSINLIDSEKITVKNNIMKNLYNLLSSYNISLGQQLYADLITLIIKDSDSRIKTVYTDSLSFDTYAVVYVDGLFLDNIKINGNDSVSYQNRYSAPYADSTVTYESDARVLSSNGHRYKNVSGRTIAFDPNDRAWLIDDFEVEIDYEKFATAKGELDYSNYSIVYSVALGTWLEGDNVETASTPANLTKYGILIISGTTENGDVITLQISKSTQIRDEIYAKSILAGKTPLYVTSEDNVDYKFGVQIDAPNADIKSAQGFTSATIASKLDTEVLIKKNEMLQFFSPNLIADTSYSNYVKFEAKLEAHNNLRANDEVLLDSNEFIIFYYKPQGDSSANYEYHVYGGGTIVKPSFALLKNNVIADFGTIVPRSEPTLESHDGWTAVNSGGVIRFEADSSTYPLIDSLSLRIEQITTSSYVLSGSKQIDIERVDKSVVTNQNYCYWILNSATADGKYVLFNEGETERILGNGEYFIYSNSKLENMVIYREGTRVTREIGTGELWVSNAVDYVELLNLGMQSLRDVWMQPNENNPITLISNKYEAFGEGNYVKFQFNTTLCKVNYETYQALITALNGESSASLADGQGIHVQKQESKYNLFVSEILPSKRTYTYTSDEDFEEELEENGYVDVGFYRLIHEIEINFSGNIRKYLLNFNISYKRNYLDQYTAFPLVSIVDGTGWDARMLLLLSFTKDSVLILYEGLKVILYPAYGNLEVTIDVEEEATTRTVPELTGQYVSNGYQYTVYNKALYSNIPVYSEGTSAGDTYSRDASGTINYATITETTYCSGESRPIEFIPQASGSMVMEIESVLAAGGKQLNSALAPVKLTSGNYMCNLSSSSEEIHTLIIDILDEQLNEIALMSEDDIILGEVATKANLDSYTGLKLGDIIIVLEDEVHDNKQTYYKYGPSGWALMTDKLCVSYIYDSTHTDLASAKESPVKFTIPKWYSNKLLYFRATVDTVLTKTEIISFSNPKRFVYSDYAVEDKYSDKYFRIKKYEKLINYMDTEHVFNYTYDINENELILNPLEPNSFLNSNHPFNAYTICLYDSNDQKIEIIGKD